MPRRALALSLLLAGCSSVPNFTGPSPLKDEDPVTLTGRALDVAGQPLVAAKLVLAKEFPEQRDRDNGTASVELATDATGTYSHTTKGYQTKNAGGEAHFYALNVGAAPGPRLARRFQFRTLGTTLEPLQLWDGLPAPTTDDKGVTVAWQGPPGTLQGYDMIVSRGGQVVWQVSGPAVGTKLPYYRFAATLPYDLSVVARQADTTFTSTDRTFTPPSDAGKRVLNIVAVTDGKGVVRPGLFDGTLTAPAFMAKETDTGTEHKEIVIDLGEVKPVSRLVLYGGPATPLDIQVATTSGAWGARVGQAKASYDDVDLGGGNARYIRILATTDTAFLSHIHELRVIAP